MSFLTIFLGSFIGIILGVLLLQFMLWAAFENSWKLDVLVYAIIALLIALTIYFL